MIFLTVGTQLPFDRLIRTLDDIQPVLQESVFAQVGLTAEQPKNMQVMGKVDPAQFEQLMSEARVIVAHAGIGTIIAAKRHQKPIIIFPREASFGEHRNDHQLATCKQFEGRAGIYVARDGDTLKSLLLGPLNAAHNQQEQSGRDPFISSLNSLLGAL